MLNIVLYTIIAILSIYLILYFFKDNIEEWMDNKIQDMIAEKVFEYYDWDNHCIDTSRPEILTETVDMYEDLSCINCYAEKWTKIIEGNLYGHHFQFIWEEITESNSQ